MKKQILVATISAAGVLAAVAGIASARSLAAFSGRPTGGANFSCFTAFGTTGHVQNSCGFTGFMVPLVVDTGGGKSVGFTARASATGSSCRSVSNNRFGTALAASPSVPIPVSGPLQLLTTASISIPSAGVFFMDCGLQNGTVLGAFNYTG